MMEEGASYEFINDRRTNGIDKVDGKLQEEHNEEERRHASVSLGLQEQTIIWLTRQVW